MERRGTRFGNVRNSLREISCQGCRRGKGECRHHTHTLWSVELIPSRAKQEPRGMAFHAPEAARGPRRRREEGCCSSLLGRAHSARLGVRNKECHNEPCGLEARWLEFNARV